MKANELRIGNYILNENGNVVLLCKSRFRVMIKGNINYQPIPLTEEWLLRFWFERSGLYFVKSQVYIYDEYGLTDTGFEYRFNYTQIKLMYVHELQNLYFALTGEELTFKSE
jgi:hypothetical protein